MTWKPMIKNYLDRKNKIAKLGAPKPVLDIVKKILNQNDKGLL